jgi:Flp pilus assembly protein TadG
MDVDCAVMTARVRRLAPTVAMLSPWSSPTPAAPPTRTPDCQRPRRTCEGRAALEFALSSLLLFTMVFGAIDLGRLVMQRTMLTNAVREAARQGVVTPGNKAAMASAANARSPMIALTSADLTVTCFGSTGVSTTCSSSLKPLDQLNVCTTHTFNLVAAGLIGFKQITATECERANVQ